jgi:hypothetical protein
MELEAHAPSQAIQAKSQGMMSMQRSMVDYLGELRGRVHPHGQYPERKELFAEKEQASAWPHDLSSLSKSLGDLDIGFILAAIAPALSLCFGVYDFAALALNFAFNDTALATSAVPMTSYGFNLYGNNECLNRFQLLCASPSSAVQLGRVVAGAVDLNIVRARPQHITVYADTPDIEYGELAAFQLTVPEREYFETWIHTCVEELCRLVKGVAYSEMLEFMAACALSIHGQQGMVGDVVNEETVTAVGIENRRFKFPEYLILRYLLDRCRFVSPVPRGWTVGQLHTAVVNLKAIAFIDYQLLPSVHGYLALKTFVVPPLVRLIGGDEATHSGGGMRVMANMYSLTLNLTSSDLDLIMGAKIDMGGARSMTITLTSTDWTFQIKYQNLMARLLGPCGDVMINGQQWENYTNLPIVNHRLTAIGGVAVALPTKIFLWTLPGWRRVMNNSGTTIIRVDGMGMVNRQAGYLIAKTSQFNDAGFAKLDSFMSRLSGVGPS